MKLFVICPPARRVRASRREARSCSYDVSLLYDNLRAEDHPNCHFTQGSVPPEHREVLADNGWRGLKLEKMTVAPSYAVSNF